MSILSDYLAEIARIRATRAGTAEMSYYGALRDALNAAGARLRPKVFCVPNLSGRAGFPDMGLFVAARGEPLDDWTGARPPERGVVEIDDIPTDIAVKRDSRQVRDYLAEYGLVLVTNYRDFVLLGSDGQIREKFGFGCADAEAFFALARGTRRPAALATRFAEFLERVLLHQAPLARPEEVAFFLASYARDALARVAEHASLPAFAELAAALQEALGMRFDGERGEHLFRSTLVQTLFYGLFSAWVEVAQQGGAFDWRAAGWSLHVPFIDTLFQRIATPQSLRPLGLEEPLQWAADALGRVERAAFFARFEEAEAVRYFYEPFLAAFDPELRRALGVWYTPREIVRYMVERVDQVLRSELGVADGLADPGVWVLDPCCGTGAYLVEVLDRIRRTLEAKGEGALIAEDLKQAAMTRVAGFEIMPAPYVIAHWQVGHVLRRAGIELGRAADGRDERAAVYLTNALTGWAAPAEAEGAEPAQRGLRYTFPPLADERDEAARVKRVERILVVLGNPPYNAFAGTSPKEEAGLVQPYKEGLQRDWGIRKFNLDDLYVRFFRVAERRITEATGRGVVCFISNHSWLWYPSYVVMRRRLLAGFDRIWIDNLNGSKFETGKVSPDGSPDPSVFSTEANREGIQVGTAIALLVKRESAQDNLVRYRDFWGASKREVLAAPSGAPTPTYVPALPLAKNRFEIRAAQLASDYVSWTSLPSIASSSPFSGLLEKRQGALLSCDRSDLAESMKRYFDKATTFGDLLARTDKNGPVRDMARFNAEAARNRLLQRESFSDERIRRFLLYPLDVRWAYHTTTRPIWNEPRPEFGAHVFPGNGFLVTRLRSRQPVEGSPIAWTNVLCAGTVFDLGARAFPILATQHSANLSPAARAWLASLGLPDPDADRATAFLPWHHALAIGYAPAWLAENADGIRQDWPRVPLPSDADLLRASAALGARVAILLDPDAPADGVTVGSIDPALAAIAQPTMPGGRAMTEADRALTAGWGHAGRSGAVMPGRGRLITRAYAANESATAAQATLLGEVTHDVFLNPDASWRNVPAEVWGFTIGGYQVLKKWLSYRERPLLGRPLLAAEIRYLRDVARRLAALRLLGPALDANYRACAERHIPLGPP